MSYYPLVIHICFRDFTYIEDAVEYTILSIKRGTNKILDIGTGIKTTINELANEVIKLGDKNLEPIYHSPRPDDILSRVANINNTNKILNYSPKVNLRDGLKKTYEYYTKQND